MVGWVAKRADYVAIRVLCLFHRCPSPSKVYVPPCTPLESTPTCPHHLPSPPGAPLPSPVCLPIPLSSPALRWNAHPSVLLAVWCGFFPGSVDFSAALLCGGLCCGRVCVCSLTTSTRPTMPGPFMDSVENLQHCLSADWVGRGVGQVLPQGTYIGLRGMYAYITPAYLISPPSPPIPIQDWVTLPSGGMLCACSASSCLSPIGTLLWSCCSSSLVWLFIQTVSSSLMAPR